MGFQVNVQSLQGQATKGSVVLNLADPAVDNPFEAPATFTDVPLAELAGGVGMGADDGFPDDGLSDDGLTIVTPAPLVP